MEDEYDVVKIGYGDDCQTFPITEDLKKCKESLIKQVGKTLMCITIPPLLNVLFTSFQERKKP